MNESGLILKKCIIAGAENLDRQKEYVNSLNVFPVPDGDTGTNMGLTMRSCVKQINELENITVASVAKAASNGSLMGARGNSGVILSQILRGFYKGIEKHKELTILALRDAFVEAYKVAYGAVMKPTEGTILTVARKMGEFADNEYKNYDNAEKFVRDIVIEGTRALKDTPNQLPILKEAGVVDAGGEGLMTILNGALNYRGVNIDRSQITTTSRQQLHQEVNDEEIAFGYCTEFMINGDENQFEKFRETISEFGDCLIVVPGDHIIKTHIHTNHPGRVLEEALKIGPLKDIKIDNMREQHHHLHVEDQEVEESKQETISKDYGFVTVSTGEGLNEIFRQLGVDEIITGGQTMNPSTEDIIHAIEKIPAKNIFVFPNNKNIILSAKQAKEVYSNMNKEKELYIVETKAIPEAFSSILEFDESSSPEDNHRRMERAIKDVHTAQVTYAVRDTEIGDIKVHKNDIIGIDDGEIKAVGKKVNKVAIDLLRQMTDTDKSMITIYYGASIDNKSVDELEKKATKMFSDYDVEVIEGGQPLYYYIFTLE